MFGLIAAASLLAGPARAQTSEDYPSRAVKVVVGYTLLFSAMAAIAINPHLYPKLGHDPLTALAPVAGIARTSGGIFYVNNASKVNDLPGLIQYGKVRPIAVSGPERLRDLKDAPTITELVPGFDPLAAWMGILAPAGTPAARIERIHAAVSAKTRSPRTSPHPTCMSIPRSGASSCTTTGSSRSARSSRGWRCRPMACISRRATSCWGPRISGCSRTVGGTTRSPCRVSCCARGTACRASSAGPCCSRPCSGTPRCAGATVSRTTPGTARPAPTRCRSARAATIDW